jgi:serine/threonine protein kinase
MLKNKTIGNYRIIDCIGSGGMGKVYIGEDIHLKRRVAIKVVKQELVNHPHIIERFKLEAVTLARLNHPNVATIYAFLQENNNYYIVIELISGWHLSTFIEKMGALPLSVALYFFKQVLAGVSSVHAENIVHRDLKPSNILINEKLIVKITDFGIARFESGRRFTGYDRLVGTIEYMSPEQILGQEVTTVSDIYSLGVLLFQMVTGCLPFSCDSEYQLMKSQVENPPPSPLKFKADIPNKLVKILSRALAKKPQTRFQSAEAFNNALEQIDVDTHNVTSKLWEMIQFYQLENRKTIDEISSLVLNDNYQDQMSPSKSYDIKKYTSTFMRINHEKLILFLGQRPWVGPLILFFSISIVGGLILKDNPRFNRESNTAPLEIHDNLNPVGTKAETTSRSVIRDKESQIPEANHSLLNSVQKPTDKTSVQSFPKKNTSTGQNYLFTNDGVDVERGSEVERIQITKQRKTNTKSTIDPNKKNNEWIIHK